jgi:hypothetical protein
MVLKLQNEVSAALGWGIGKVRITCRALDAREAKERRILLYSGDHLPKLLTVADYEVVSIY